MNNGDALKAIQEYYDIKNPTADDEFSFTEALGYLIEETRDPKYIEVWGKFTPRGGISIDPYCNYGKPGTKWEEVAFNRMANHDMYPEKVDNR